jgi:hypothetical protein
MRALMQSVIDKCLTPADVAAMAADPMRAAVGKEAGHETP